MIEIIGEYLGEGSVMVGNKVFTYGNPQSVIVDDVTFARLQIASENGWFKINGYKNVPIEDVPPTTPADIAAIKINIVKEQMKNMLVNEYIIGCKRVPNDPINETSAQHIRISDNAVVRTDVFTVVDINTEKEVRTLSTGDNVTLTYHNDTGQDDVGEIVWADD